MKHPQNTTSSRLFLAALFSLLSVVVLESAASGDLLNAPRGTVREGAITFRGDARAPEEIFSTGFRPRGNSADLYEYAANNTPSRFVGSSRSADVAEGFTLMNGGDKVYVIRVRPNRGIDVNRALGRRSPFPDEVEIAVPGGISPDDVLGYWTIGPGDKRIFIPNPNIGG